MSERENEPGASKLEALALILRGASHGPPLVTEGAWADLTDLQRVRWLLFAERAFAGVEMIQRTERPPVLVAPVLQRIAPIAGKDIVRSPNCCGCVSFPWVLCPPCARFNGQAGA